MATLVSTNGQYTVTLASIGLRTEVTVRSAHAPYAMVARLFLHNRTLADLVTAFNNYQDSDESLVEELARYPAIPKLKTTVYPF